MTARQHHSWIELEVDAPKLYPVRCGRTPTQEQKRLTKAFWAWQHRGNYPHRRWMKIKTRQTGNGIEVRRTV